MKSRLLLVSVLALLLLSGCAYYGVMEPSRKLPSKCASSPSLPCKGLPEVDTSANTLTVSLINNAGRSVDINNVITQEGDCDGIEILSVNGDTTFPVTVENNQDAVLEVRCGSLSEDRFRTDLHMFYTISGSELERPFDVGIALYS